MLIKQIRIRRLKSVDYLDMTLDDGITLLYGPNGIGKSTVLEAISLAGHLCHFPIFELLNGKFSGDSETYRELEESLNHSPGYLSSLETWFNSNKIGAAVSLDIKDGDVSEGTIFRCYLYMNITNVQIDPEHKELSLTSLLSSEYKDEDLGKRIAIVVDAGCRHAVEKIRTKILKGQSYPREPDGLIVSYINTDLNDFGRHNDLRESPKDLGRDFVDEMKHRLQIPFDGKNGELRHLREVNNVLKKVLKYPKLYVPGIDGEYSSFRLSKCEIDPTTNKLTINASRLADNREYSTLDFMSAGENECVFVFSILLHLPLTSGVVLLDEPDLHITSHQKKEFFNQLYKLLRDNDVQSVICTHSEYALAGFSNVGYRVLRPKIIDDKNGYRFILVADDGIDLRLEHSKILLGRALASLRHTGLFGVRTFVGLIKNFEKLKDQVFFFVNIAIVVFMLACLTLATSSDVFLTFFNQSQEEHDALAGKFAWGAIGSSITLCAFLTYAYVFNLIERRKQRLLIKKALAEKSKLMKKG